MKDKNKKLEYKLIETFPVPYLPLGKGFVAIHANDFLNKLKAQRQELRKKVEGMSGVRLLFREGAVDELISKKEVINLLKE